MHHHQDDNFPERKIYFADFHVNIHFSSLQVSSYPCMLLMVLSKVVDTKYTYYRFFRYICSKMINHGLNHALFSLLMKN